MNDTFEMSVFIASNHKADNKINSYSSTVFLVGILDQSLA